MKYKTFASLTILGALTMQVCSGAVAKILECRAGEIPIVDIQAGAYNEDDYTIELERNLGQLTEDHLTTGETITTFPPTETYWLQTDPLLQNGGDVKGTVTTTDPYANLYRDGILVGSNGDQADIETSEFRGRIVWKSDHGYQRNLTPSEALYGLLGKKALLCGEEVLP
jgi:hypothetical protein